MTNADWDWLQERLGWPIPVMALNFWREDGELWLISIYSDDGVISLFIQSQGVEYEICK